MVAHDSGVIGLPLRLLAREVYGRVVDKVGASKVALITGEEKIVPPGARFSVCTVEAMPRQTDASFVAIDEVQLAGDFERGHIFTDRILHLRGRHETLLLGAHTMRGILEKLLRGINVVTRPRLSHLAYAGSRKLTRLPRRSAIVAFSADEVYAIAELIRRRHGGAAVVLGALSPRTRNAQVELYQSGDVDYLVATDAIGMGLNLDVDHVAFAQDRKFDGHQYRHLTPAEIGQIAGRAGRHLRDGTFGETGRIDSFDQDLVEKVESHDFEPVRVLQWRSAAFDFASLGALKQSIDAVPTVEGLTRALPAADLLALEHISRDDDVARLADKPNRVALLWDCCALPDYRRIAPAQHAELVSSIFTDIAKRGHVDENYLAQQVKQASSTEGDIDVLSARIAQIRTWTFVSHRPGWLADPAHWQEKTREIEDALSDALHERLTKRFVDRRTSVLMRRLRENSMLEAEINSAGAVLVEGHHVGELQGFRFTADQSADGEDARAVRGAAQKALAGEYESRAQRFANCPNGDLALGSDGVLRWIGVPVATLTAGESALKPRVVLLADEQLTGTARDIVQARAERFVAFQVETHLKPLNDLAGAEALQGMARGLAFRLVENLGVVNRRDVAEDVRSLDQDQRGALRRLGVRFGAYHVFLPALLKPAPAGLLTLVWALANDAKDKPGFGDVVNLLASGRTSVVVDPTFEKAFYRLAGYRILGRRAVRVDILERLADLIRPALSWKPGTGARPDGGFDAGAFVVTPPMMSILGANADDMEEILKGLGYRGEPKPATEVAAKLEAHDVAFRAAEAAKAAAVQPVEPQELTADPSVAPTIAQGAEPVAGETSPDGADDDAEVSAVGPDIAHEEPAPDPATQDQGDDYADPAVAPTPVEAVEAAGQAPAEVHAEAVEVTVAEQPPEAVVAPEATAEPAEAPKPIMVWRQGRFGDRNRQGHGERRGPRHRGRPGGQRPGEAAATEGAAAGGDQQTGERSDRGPDRNRGNFRGREGERGEKRFGGKPGENRTAEGRSGEGRPGGDKPWQRDRNAKPRDGEERQGRGGGRRDNRRDDRRDDRERGKPQQVFASTRPRDEKPGRIDPDSPFAKLAALRDQLRK
ncbi:MAG: helicase [Rhizobiaceae bacterium]|nr:helicase [Rhizobiaceae bacterium]